MTTYSHTRHARPPLAGVVDACVDMPTGLRPSLPAGVADELARRPELAVPARGRGLPVMRIVVDTREQHPLTWPADSGVETVRGTVPVFDYALLGDELGYAVERKSLADLVGVMCDQSEYDRETRKCQHARELWGPGDGAERPIVYVVECAYCDPLRYEWARFVSGKVTAQWFYGRLEAFCWDNGVRVVWAGDRIGAAYAVWRALREREKRRANVPLERSAVADTLGLIVGKSGDQNAQ